MRTGSMMHTRNCWLRWLLLLPLVATLGCSRSSPPPKPPQVVTVREACIRQAPPDMTPISKCLDTATSVDEAFDCLAQAILVRDAWIAAQIARCGVRQ